MFLFKSVFFKDIWQYIVPSGMRYMYTFGFILMAYIVLQISTGFFLSCYYVATVDNAFASIQYISRDVSWGSMIRYFHAFGCTLIFQTLYAHISRGLLMKSMNRYRGLVWVSGLVLYILMMAIAFLGYVLPWGQMSYWGVTVITNLITVVPYVGQDILTWFWGGTCVNGATLSRVYSLHFILPLVMLAIAGVHIVALHDVGSSTNLGLQVFKVNYIVFPDLLYKELFFLSFLFLYCSHAIFYHNYTTVFGGNDGLIEADPMVTPLHIAPEWYFLPFYAILRSIPNKVIGVCAMFISIIAVFI